MSEVDLKLIYQLIENKFRISQEEIEKIDLQDGQKDARINGISLFHFFENGSFTTKETLKDLSIFMSNKDKIKIEKISNNFLKELNTPKETVPAYDIVKRLISEIYKIGFANIDKPIADIDENNVVEVLEKYKKASDKKNSIAGKVYDHETLFEAILDESLSDNKKKKYINHIKNALIKRINNLSGDASFTGQLFSAALDSAIKKWWPFQNSDKLDKLCNQFIKIIKQLESMKEAGEKVTPAKAKKINKGFVQELNWMGISTHDLLGNGIFDNEAIQESENCWIHAGINAMLQTPASREHLNNLVHKSSNGNIVVYLPGAKDEGIPKPKGNGIFVYTERQISAALKEESAGDGEYTAMCLAIRDFRREKTGDPKATTEGGYFEEFCKLVYGKNSETIRFCDRGSQDSKDHAKMAKEYLDTLTLSDDDKERCLIAAAQDSYSNTYKNIKKAFDEKTYIFKVSISGANYYRLLDNKPVVPDENSGHALTILSMSDSEVCLKDSNAPMALPLKISASDFVRICFVDGFKVS